MSEEEIQIFKSVKIPLKSILKNKNDITKINKLIIEINKLIIHSYNFIKLYILKCYPNNIPEINEEFISKCIKTLYIHGNSGPKFNKILQNQLNIFYEEYQQCTGYVKPTLNNLSQISKYITVEILTVIKTNIKEHFVDHFERFVKITNPGKDGKIVYNFTKKLLNYENTFDLEFLPWINEHLNNILPPKDLNFSKKLITYDVDSRPLLYLRGMIYMNHVYEKINLDRGEHDQIRQFNCLPLRTEIKPKHILLDTTCIIEYFYEELENNYIPDTPRTFNIHTGEYNPQIKNFILKTHMKRDIGNNKHIVWTNFLNFNHKLLKNNKDYKFHHQIKTDGFSCSLLFSKEVYVKENTSFKKLEEYTGPIPKNIIGCDPGKRNLVYMIDSNGKKLRYTVPQRDHESKSKRGAQILEAEKKKTNISELESKLASLYALSNGKKFRISSKTVNYEGFKIYLRVKTQLNEQVHEFYEKEIWRKIKFRQYSYGKKSLDTFLNKMEKTFGKDILIGYGNWRPGNHQMKNSKSSLNIGLRRKIHKRFKTITVEEFNTSKKCCNCYGEMDFCKDKEGKYLSVPVKKDPDKKDEPDKFRKVFRLLHCSTCKRLENGRNAYKTRDVSAAVNIREITKSWLKNKTRPVAFCHANKEIKKTENPIVIFTL